MPQLWVHFRVIPFQTRRVVERETEETTDKEQSNFQGSTAQIPPPVIPISISKPVVLKTLPKTTPIPILRFDISFADALLLMPRFAPTIKSLLMNKEKLLELAKIPLNENCSAILLKKIPEKLGDPGLVSYSIEYERYVNSDFVTHLHPKEFATFDVLGFWKEKETMYPVLSRMAMDIISVQASSVASESAFSTSGRVLSIRRTRLTPASLEMCMCLKDHLDAKERKQDKSPLEIPLDFEEDVLDDEVQQNEAIPLSDEEIALDASSEGTLSPGGPRYDYMMSSEEAEDDY
ncbi:zinc finger BED domain-containing protein RICESLEEPER 2 [Tanacetum coccineum]